TYTSGATVGEAVAVDLVDGSLDYTGPTGATPLRAAVNEIGTTTSVVTFFLPRTATLSIDKKGSSTKDSLVGSGYIDDGGSEAVDYTQPVRMQIGAYD